MGAYKSTPIGQTAAFSEECNALLTGHGLLIIEVIVNKKDASSGAVLAIGRGGRETTL